MRPPGSKERRFTGIKDLFNHLNAVGSRGLAAIGGKSRSRLQDEDKLVTLQVGRSVFEGAPRNMRVELWMSSLQRKGIGVAAADKYQDMLLTAVGEEAASDIEKDLDRTFPSSKRFTAAEGQAALRRVLRAYAAYDPEVGYCQGMNFVAGLLLMYLPERHAFGGLVVLMHDRGLRKYYSTDMSLLQTHLWQLGRLMPPCLCAHLESCGVLPLLYGASWLMTCFSADFPASFSARVMDVIMADKMDQALLKAAVALLKRCEAKLLQLNDMEDALRLLKLELPAWEEPLLHDVLTDAFSKPWSSRQLQLLGSTEGAETVAEALARVQRTNLAASMDSISDSIDGSATGDSGPLAVTPGSSRPATPSGGPAAAAGHAVAGSSGGGGGPGGATSGTLLLFPPPPSPRRSSSGAAGLSSSSQPPSRGNSQLGMSCGLNLLDASEAAQTGSMQPHAPAAGLPHGNGMHGVSAAAAAAADLGLGSLAPEQQQQQQHADLIDMSSPRASIAESAPPAWHGGISDDGAASTSGRTSNGDHQQSQQQRQQEQQHRTQQQQQLPSRDWDPFLVQAPSLQHGLPDLINITNSGDGGSNSIGQQQQEQGSIHPEQTQQQHKAEAAGQHESLWQQMQDLSFTQLAGPSQQHSAAAASHFHHAYQHKQQQQQQHKGQVHPTGMQRSHLAPVSVGSTQQQQLGQQGQAAHHVSKAASGDDEWGDFLSPTSADRC